jgi:cell division septal protein FtsQ
MAKTYRKPYRVKRKKSIISYRFLWLGTLFFFIILAIFYFLFFSEVFQIEKVIVTGEEKVAKEDLELLVEKKLEKKILFFKTKSIFAVDTQNIKEDILNNFPSIAEVEISRGFPDALNIVVVERLGLTIWCQEEQCFLLDGEGVIFASAGNDIPDGVEEIPKKVRIIDQQNINSLKLGDKVIEKEKLNQILDIESKLKDNLKIPLTAFEIISKERLNIGTLEGWEIYFNSEGDREWQLTKLRAVLEEEILPENRKNLEYIDLRFGNLAPYKYKD